MWSIAERSTRGRSIDFDCTFAAIHVMLEFVWRKKWRIHSCDSDTLQHMLCWACDVYCIKNREYRHFPMFFCCCLIICASFSHMTWHFDFELGAFMGIPFAVFNVHIQFICKQTQCDEILENYQSNENRIYWNLHINIRHLNHWIMELIIEALPFEYLSYIRVLIFVIAFNKHFFSIIHIKTDIFY